MRRFWPGVNRQTPVATSRETIGGANSPGRTVNLVLEPRHRRSQAIVLGFHPYRFSMNAQILARSQQPAASGNQQGNNRIQPNGQATRQSGSKTANQFCTHFAKQQNGQATTQSDGQAVKQPISITASLQHNQNGQAAKR